MDAAVAIDLDGRILDWNQQAETQFGWTRAEAIGRSLAQSMLPEETRTEFVEGLKAFRDSGESPVLGERIETTAVRKDGAEFPVEISAAPIEVDGVTVIHAFVRDISDWQQTEDRIAREQLEAKLLHQSATLSLGEKTFDEALQNCLSTVCETTGWTVGHVLIPNHVTGKLECTGEWHLEAEELYDAFRAATIDRQFGLGEGLPGRIWKTREPIWIESIPDEPDFDRKCVAAEVGVQGAFGFPVVCNDEVVAVLEFFHRDEIEKDPNLLILVRSIGREFGRIIERRAAIEKQSLLAAVVETSSDAVISKSLDGTILSWNAGAQRIYGFTSEEAVGQPASIVIPDTHTEEEPEIREVLRRGKRLVHFETQRRRKDGVLIDVSLSVSPIWSSDRRIVGSSTIERDITLQKKRERELTDAKEQAEAANRTKSEFLTNISHELRTPMNAIIGMLELALGEELSKVMEDYLQTARDSAHTLLHLLNDLLDFSRMEAGRFEMEHSPFRLRGLLDQTMKMLALRANEKGLELACHVHSNVADHFRGDAKRLQQILINLVGNGIKFTEQGEVIIDVELRSSVEDNAVLQFTVIDTGIGISSKDQKKIFAPFTQADATTTRKYTGTGLGLSICRELVDRMGGEMWIESKLGEGSRFYFTVCVEAIHETDEASEQAIIDSELKNMPVLIVDDNESNRRILDEMLKSWDMNPTVVESGDEALAVMEESMEGDLESFPLVLIDALMPKIDGFTLIEKARNKGILRGSTVLMLSSADRQLFHDRCERLEISAYLEKPVSQSDLFDAVVTALHRPETSQRGSMPRPESDRPCHVLLVEDTRANQKVVEAILRKWGHHVTVAGNGREGIDLLKQQQFDIVLMDIQMPTMDGFQATEAIRRFEDDRANIPIVAMTAHAMLGDRERCLEAGMDAYISKPIDAGELIDIVERMAIPRSPAARPPTPNEETVRNDNEPRGHPAVPRIDRESALKRLGGDEELLDDMIGYFIEDAGVLLQSIREGLANDEFAEVRRAAHSLKGLASNLGAERTVELAGALEKAAEKEQAQEAQQLTPRVESETNALIDELKGDRPAN